MRFGADGTARLREKERAFGGGELSTRRRGLHTHIYTKRDAASGKIDGYVQQHSVSAIYTCVKYIYLCVCCAALMESAT